MILKRVLKSEIFIYSLILTVLLVILKTVEYKFLIRDISIEVYIAIISLFFTALGIWVGLKMIKPKQVSLDQPFDEEYAKEIADKYYLSKRELEVLSKMSEGLSNQEIADSLFISLPTVKTHSTNIFSKLEVQRRTQAILKAKELRILPN